MGHLIGPGVPKHIVVAAHRTDIVISRAAKDPIGGIGALAHLTALTGYSLALHSTAIEAKVSIKVARRNMAFSPSL
jgi:hypothetical protein